MLPLLLLLVRWLRLLLLLLPLLLLPLLLRLLLFLLSLSVFLFSFRVPPHPVAPCTGWLCTAGVESMWVISLRLTLTPANILLLRHVRVSDHLFHVGTSQARAGQQDFLFLLVRR